jgi:hypothetical protein
VGFEAMPQLADLEIAATWDEIELEAALRGGFAEAQAEPSLENPARPSEAELARAVEELKQLPKAERKQRAQDLLRALTSAPPAEPAQPAEPEAAPEPPAPQLAEDAPELEPAAALAPEVSEPLPAEEPPSAEPAIAAEPAQVVQAASEPMPDAPADTAPPADAAASAPPAEATPEVAPEPAPISTAALEPCPIPSFLATECPSLEPERLDSLIPFRTVAAAGALVGAVLLIYFWSPQETGLAARTVAGETSLSVAPVVPTEVPPSVAVRQAFVSLTPTDAVSEAMRSYRPPFVGFDYLDDPAPPVTVATATPAPAPTPRASVAPIPSTAAVIALPPAPSADATALIKRGDELLKAGDIAAARSAFERAAASGSAKAQIGVGKTYDPLVLAKLGARGVRGDPVQAAAWYARAGEAGDDEGQQRLHALIAGLSDCIHAQGACAPRKP